MTEPSRKDKDAMDPTLNSHCQWSVRTAPPLRPCVPIRSTQPPLLFRNRLRPPVINLIVIIGLTQKRTESNPHPHIGGLYGETNTPGLLPVSA